jgi:hypothetical protein
MSQGKRVKLLLCASLLCSGLAQAATFNAPVTVAGNGGSEPGIDVAPDGTLYIATATGLTIGAIPPSVSAIYRSDNGGATWVTTPLGLRQVAIGGGDIDLTAAPDNGTISTTDLWLGSSSVATSSDKGNTWLALPLNGSFVEDRQWVAAVGGGRVYHVVHQIPLGDVVSLSTDSGLLYPLQTLAATPVDQQLTIGPPGNLVAENGGLLNDRVAFVYGVAAGGFGFARSTNGALTWTNTYPGSAAGAGTTGFPSIADDGHGDLAVAWIPGSSGTVYLITSTDFGATWTAPRAIVSSGTSVYCWVAYRNGKIAVSLYHTTAAGTSDTVAADAVWNLSYTDSSDNFGTLTDVETAIHTGPICTAGINCSANRELGDFQQVGIDNAGKSVVSYVRDVAGGTEVRFAKQQ